MTDPENLFNTRLDSKTVRAIDIYQDTAIDEKALRELYLEAAALNTAAVRKH